MLMKVKQQTPSRRDRQLSGAEAFLSLLSGASIASQPFHWKRISRRAFVPHRITQGVNFGSVTD